MYLRSVRVQFVRYCEVSVCAVRTANITRVFCFLPAVSVKLCWTCVFTMSRVVKEDSCSVHFVMCLQSTLTSPNQLLAATLILHTPTLSGN